MGVAAPWRHADEAVAEGIAASRSLNGGPIVAGLAGAQGSGKSTMAPRVASLLERRGLRTAILSLDDFYLPQQERRALAERIHPLLVTRGVPGTHDVALLHRALDALLSNDTREIAVPRFDKSADDRARPTEWLRISGEVDVVLLEGWCVGARPQSGAELIVPVNSLERDEDMDGRWRRWVNDCLAGDYAALFNRLAITIFLRAPSFAVVEGWRAEQEATLDKPGMIRRQLRRFVAHYERITRAMIADPPADLVIELDASRTPLV